MLVKSKLHLVNGSVIDVDLFEWADLTLFGEERNEWATDLQNWYTELDQLKAAGTYDYDPSMDEVDENGNMCLCFVLPQAPAVHPVAEFTTKWSAKFAADPNVEYSGMLYKYLRDV